MKVQSIKKRLEDLVNDHVVPGISYAIIDGDRTEVNVFGKAQLVPQEENLHYGMLYDVASLTKVVGTTTVILHLVEQGKLSLDDCIADWIPRFKDPRVTIRHLLTHTSAIGGYIPNRDQLAAQDLLDKLDDLPVNDWFDHKVVYTDVGMIILGQIIELCYQQPVQNVITKQVLDPLNLTESTFTPNKKDCVPTEMSTTRGLIRGIVHDPKAYTLKEHCGSAGLFMSLNDLIKFSNWILSSDHQNDVLSNNTIEMLFKDWTTDHLGRSLGWNLRFGRDNQAWIYHTGFTGTFMLLNKKKQQALIVLTNRIHPSAINQEFLDRRDEIVAEFIK